MKQKLSFSNRILIGFTLFSLFFGAGNLIFPPFLGYEAGDHLWPAAAGFIPVSYTHLGHQGCIPFLGQPKSQRISPGPRYSLFLGNRC